MRKNPLDFCKKVVNKLKNKYKNREIRLATIAIIIMGCFFYGNYAQNVLVKDVKAKESHIFGEKNTIKIAQNFNLGEARHLRVIGENYSLVFKDSKKDEEDKKISYLEEQIKDITRSHPIEEMAPFIANYDKKVAALIVGIAKKESSWGLHSPSKNGKTCYNYWGYKGTGSRGSALGYSCFETPQEAVDTIGDRIERLVNQNIDTPAKMVVWKCGRSCEATGGQAAANKWIADVSIYYKRIAMLAS